MKHPFKKTLFSVALSAGLLTLPLASYDVQAQEKTEFTLPDGSRSGKHRFK